MKIEGLMPVGSVVMLKGGNHRVMIIGYCQRLSSAPEHVYDYVACFFPEGYLSPEKNFVFDRDQVEKVYHVGYQTDGQAYLVEQMEAAIAKARGESSEEA